jgi:hypothetical protein
MDFNPGMHPDDREKPFDTGVYLTTDVSELLANKIIDNYIVDSMSGTCSGTSHSGETAQVLILNWNGFILFNNAPLC